MTDAETPDAFEQALRTVEAEVTQVRVPVPKIDAVETELRKLAAELDEHGYVFGDTQQKLSESLVRVRDSEWGDHLEVKNFYRPGLPIEISMDGGKIKVCQSPPRGDWPDRVAEVSEAVEAVRTRLLTNVARAPEPEAESADAPAAKAQVREVRGGTLEH